MATAAAATAPERLLPQHQQQHAQKHQPLEQQQEQTVERKTLEQPPRLQLEQPPNRSVAGSSPVAKKVSAWPAQQQPSVSQLYAHAFTRLAKEHWQFPPAVHPDLSGFLEQQLKQERASAATAQARAKTLQLQQDSQHQLEVREGTRRRTATTSAASAPEDAGETKASTAAFLSQRAAAACAAADRTAAALRKLQHFQQQQTQGQSQQQFYTAQQRQQQKGVEYAVAAAVIEKIYEELRRTNFSRQHMMVLEFSLYLENYLWPYFPIQSFSSGEAVKSTEEASAESGEREHQSYRTQEQVVVSKAHLMSIVMMLVEKQRKGVPLWENFLSHPLLRDQEHAADHRRSSSDHAHADSTSETSKKAAPRCYSAAPSSGTESQQPLSRQHAPAGATPTSSTTAAHEIFLEQRQPVLYPYTVGFAHAKFAAFVYRLLELYVRAPLVIKENEVEQQQQQEQSNKEVCLPSGATAATTDTQLSLTERSYILRFLIVAFQALEEPMLRKVSLSLCGALMWQHLPPHALKQLQHQSAAAVLLWEKTARKRKLLQAVQPKQAPVLSSNNPEAYTRALLDRDFFPALLHQFFYLTEDFPQRKLVRKTAVEEGQEGDEDEVEVCLEAVDLCERVVEFLVDLLGQLPTRRCILPLIQNMHVVVRARLSILNQNKEAGVFRQLLELLDYYTRFEINDDTGQALTLAEGVTEHYRRVAVFQRFCYSVSDEIPSLKEAALSAISAVDSTAALRLLLHQQELLTLLRAATALGLVDPHRLPGAPATSEEVSSSFLLRSFWGLQSQRKSKRWIRGFLVDLLVSHLQRRADQIEQINMLSLYPTEEETWNEVILPSPEKFTGETALALPKLNLQFLTVHDYLLRNFNLFRLESMYEIREDIEDVIKRMRPRRRFRENFDEEGETVFDGSARMGLPLQRLSIIAVENPRVGEHFPSEVHAELTLDLKGLRPQLAQEWDSLRRYDVLFLLAVVAPLPSSVSQDQSFPEQFGVMALRGCEVVEVLDEDGRCISEFNPFTSLDGSNNEGSGTVRTIRVLLDSRQYYRDVLHVEETGDGQDPSEKELVLSRDFFYSSFNVVMRRQARSNNFKGVLQTIRDVLLTAPQGGAAAVLPEWLCSLFLGYGHPDSAHFTQLKFRFKSVDLRDSFLDAEHFFSSFPQSRALSLANPHSKEIHFPQTSKGNELHSASHKAANGEFLVRLSVEADKEESDSLTKTKDCGSADSFFTNSVIQAQTYALPSFGPYPACARNRNTLRYTPKQVECLVSGSQPGLTVVVGPPGSGKTDTAAQLAVALYHAFPSEKLLILSHSNSALNELFRKILLKDVDETHLLRLGRGEKQLLNPPSGSLAKKPTTLHNNNKQANYKRKTHNSSTPDTSSSSSGGGSNSISGGGTNGIGYVGFGDESWLVEEDGELEEDFSFSQHGRVNLMLERRKFLLSQVKKLGECVAQELGSAASVGAVDYSCENALQFRDFHVLLRMQRFRKLLQQVKKKARRLFPDKGSPKRHSSSHSPSLYKKQKLASVNSSTQKTNTHLSSPSVPTYNQNPSQTSTPTNTPPQPPESSSQQQPPITTSLLLPQPTPTNSIPPPPPVPNTTSLPPQPTTPTSVPAPSTITTTSLPPPQQPSTTTSLLPPSPSSQTPPIITSTSLLPPSPTPPLTTTTTSILPSPIITTSSILSPERKPYMMTSLSAPQTFVNKCSNELDQTPPLLDYFPGVPPVISAPLTSSESAPSESNSQLFSPLLDREEAVEKIPLTAAAAAITERNRQEEIQAEKQFEQALQTVVTRLEREMGRPLFVRVNASEQKLQTPQQRLQNDDNETIKSSINSMSNSNIIKSEDERTTLTQQQTPKHTITEPPDDHFIRTTHDDGMIWVPAMEAYKVYRRSYVELLFPFTSFFADAPQPLFSGNPKTDEEKAESCFRYIDKIFTDLNACKAFELLRSGADRANYLLTCHARMIAMTCTHAAIAREKLIKLNFQYDSLLIEESAQILEVETFLPMLLQKCDNLGKSRLKRLVLFGDHHQLPPIVKHLALQKYCNLEQSLYARLVRLRVPTICLDMQGRSRSALARLYAWRYMKLEDMPEQQQQQQFQLSNPGFSYVFQFINVEDYGGKGESAPLPHFYQNLGEAEYLVALYMYMRVHCQIPAEKVSILTTYRGQVALLTEVLQQRCLWNPAVGPPKHVTTVDQFQGLQNDYILLSLVRTERVGHLRDIRRLVVAVSRARLGFYVFGRWKLFSNCVEMRPVFRQFATRPLQLCLQLSENTFTTNRKVQDEELYTADFSRNVDVLPCASVLPPGSTVVADVLQLFAINRNSAIARVEALKRELSIPSVVVGSSPALATTSLPSAPRPRSKI